MNGLTSQTSTPVSGAATTTTDSYPAAGSALPHAVTTQQAAGPAGTSRTSYGYNADGATTSVSSPASAQALNWNDAGQLASDTTTGASAGTTSYVYDATGRLLLQSDPGSVTLYLPDEQIVENTTTNPPSVSATRYYSIGGVTVAARTSAGDVQYLTGDQQGTATLAIDYGHLDLTRRYYDPYGNPVGAAPASWPGTRGFVGGTADPAPGYTNLGAREYNPVSGAFISPDSHQPLRPAEPQRLRVRRRQPVHRRGSLGTDALLPGWPVRQLPVPRAVEPAQRRRWRRWQQRRRWRRRWWRPRLQLQPERL
jgi:RHS repeat-associated protein